MVPSKNFDGYSRLEMFILHRNTKHEKYKNFDAPHFPYIQSFDYNIYQYQVNSEIRLIRTYCNATC